MLKRLGKDIAVYGGTDLLFRTAQLLVVPVYAHQLSLADFGIWSLLTISMALLGMLAALGVNSSVQRFYFDPELEAARPKLISTGFVQLLASGTLLTLVLLLVLLGLRSEIEGTAGLSWMLVLVALLTLLPDQVSQYFLDSIRLRAAPLKFVAVGLVRNLGAVAMGLVFLIHFDLGVLGLLLGTLTASSAAVLLGLVLLRQDIGFRVDRGAARKILLYGFPFVLTGAAYWVFGSVGNWMLGALTTIDEVGLFAIGMKFSVVMTFLITGFAQAWTVFAMRLYGEDPDYLRKWSMVFSAWFFLLALAGLGLALFAPELLRLLTPPRYWDAAPVLGIAALGLAFFGTQQLTVLGISITKKTMLLNHGAWLAAALAITLNLLLIPRFGATGAALATMAAYALLTSFLLFWSQRLHPMPLETGKLLYSVGIVGVGLAAVAVVNGAEVNALNALLKVALMLLAIGGAVVVGILNPAHLRALLRRDQVQPS